MKQALAALALVAALGFVAPEVASAQTVAPAVEDQAKKPLPPGRVEIRVGDLHCKTCAKKVARKLYAVKGVRKVTSSLKNDLVVAVVSTKTPIAPEKLWQAVEAGDVAPVELRYADQTIDAEQMKTRLAQAEMTAR